jgi:hypothetical protein
MGILGRRRASTSVAANTDGMELQRRQLTGPNAALRLLAKEAQILTFEGENAAQKPAEMLGCRDHLVPIQNGSAGTQRNVPLD